MSRRDTPSSLRPAAGSRMHKAPTCSSAEGEKALSCRNSSPGAIPTRCGDSRSSWPGLSHWRPARFVLEEAHGIDSTRFQLVTNHLDTKTDQRRPASEYRFSWASKAYSVVDVRSACGSVRGRLGWPCREDQGPFDRDAVWAVLRRTESARD